MTKRSFTARSLPLIAAAGLMASCDDPKSNLPTSPGLPHAASVQIDGPASVAPGQTAQFTVMVFESDGTTKLATSPTARWISSNPSVLSVNAAGLANAGSQQGEAMLTVEVTPGAGSTLRQSTREIVVLPEGTYRVVGRVVDADAPTLGIPNARVEVTSGTPLSVTTGTTGDYRLYGVPADADIQATAAGYHSQVQNVHLSGHTTRNFQLALSGAPLSLSGNYTLTIDVLSGCNALSGLTADLQHRSYHAVLTQNGAALEVVLTEPRFRVNGSRGNRFSGRVLGGGATFTLDYYDYYYASQYPNVAEQLPDGGALVVAGTTVVDGSTSGLVGSLTGGLERWGLGFPIGGSYLGGCYGPIQFRLSPR